jgi:hypothetical protein
MVHVSPTEEEAERFQRSWQAWGEHLPLEVVVSPYRATVAPLANYIAALHRQRPDVTLTLVVPEVVVAKHWQRILHSRIAARLRASLIAYEGIVITTVPFHLPGERGRSSLQNGCFARPGCPSSYDWSRTHARRRGGSRSSDSAKATGVRRASSALASGRGPRHVRWSRARGDAGGSRSPPS